MMRTQSALPQGCTPEVLAQLAACGRCWRDGGEPAATPRVAPALPPGAPRDVYMLFISGAKERAPAAAMGLIAALNAAG